MLYKTQGIFLNQIKYTDNSVIAHIYTQRFGTQTYLIGNIHKKHTKRSTLLQPLFLLDMEVYYKQKREIQKVKEINLSYPYKTIPYNPIKRTIAIFISEILAKSIQEEEPNEQLFTYIKNTALMLDMEESSVVNFHLIFLIQLAEYIGFKISSTQYHNYYFDLKEGIFTRTKPLHIHYIEPQYAVLLNKLVTTNLIDASKCQITQNERSRLLEKLIEYYKLHLLHLKDIKSFEVLRDVFNN